MNEDLLYFPCFMKSANIIQEYDNLIDIECVSGCGKEYKNKIKSIKKLVTDEEEYYKKINIDDVKRYIKRIEANKDMLIDPAINRYYVKLMSRKRILDNEFRLDNDTLFVDVIESKILLDTLYLAKKTILNEKADNIYEHKRKENFLDYFNEMKYSILVTNNYIEKLSLIYDFDIDRIPQIDFKVIEDKFKLPINFLYDAGEFLTNRCIDNINEYNDYLNMNCDYDDDINDKLFFKVYMLLIIKSEIEVLLPLIDKKNLENISNHLKKFKKNDGLIYIEELIKKRKRD